MIDSPEITQLRTNCWRACTDYLAMCSSLFCRSALNSETKLHLLALGLWPICQTPAPDDIIQNRFFQRWNLDLPDLPFHDFMNHMRGLIHNDHFNTSTVGIWTIEHQSFRNIVPIHDFDPIQYAQSYVLNVVLPTIEELK